MPGSLETLIGPVSHSGLALMAGTVLLAGFIRGFVGFGAALIIVMVLSVALGPLVAVPIAVLSGLPSMVQLLPTAVRFAERPFVVPFGLASFAAAPVGAWVLMSVDPAVMKMSISAFVLAMVVMLYRGWRLVRRPGRAVLLGAGAVAGFVQGAASVGGPPAVVIALSGTGTTQQQRANVIGAVTALNICALVPFWHYGLFTREVIVISLAIIPLYAGATWVGARYFSERGHRHFRNAALLTLAVIGLLTFALAVRDYLNGA
jgi:uncharacterized membrane protein YfcA